jgi:hypothetical protein
MRYSRWDQPVSDGDGYGILKSLALRHFNAAGEPGKRFAHLLELNDLRALIQLSIDYGDLTADSARHIRQGLAFFQKRKDLDLGFDRQAEAVRKFRAAETRCRETNEIFRRRRVGEYQLFPRTERILYHSARKIARILGDVPLLSELKLHFGPGATTQIPKRMASARAKLGTVPAVSRELAPAAAMLLSEAPAWEESLKDAGPLPMVIDHGKVVFVPKSAKEYRSVMVEPSLNTMYQGGIGKFMAERLRRSGIDIRDQTGNQKAARKGSLDGSLATVDLSSASDTIALELVYDLLPNDWFFFLKRFRTGNARFEGSVISLEKFSSMGNGFTFPLETLIFYAIAYGVCVELGLPWREVRAYGDDIICPSAAYPLLESVLVQVGFEVNRSKSFSEGPFRESCGADYFQGIDIRPVYIKDRILVSDLFRLHNSYYRAFDFEATAAISEMFDPCIKLYGPDGYGDGHLLSEKAPEPKPKHIAKGWAGSVFDTFTWRPRRSFKVYAGDRVLPAYSIYTRESADYRYWLAAYEPASPDALSSKEGLSVSLPGKLGVRRISVYTLNR